MAETTLETKRELFTIEPWDKHNQKTVANVHPNDWVNPDPSGTYNLVVLGAGTAGLVSAIGSVGLGARVALIEKHLMGGDCLNVGCVPSKALIRASRAAADVRRASDYGIHGPGDVTVDFPKVMERMRRLRAQISKNDSAHRFKSRGVDVFIGEGRFTGPNTVQVNGKSLGFSKAVVATGGRPVAPPIPGLKEAGYFTNDTVFSLTELPARLAVIGAGPIGCELAQAFARFGSKVSLLQTRPQILVREDRDAAQRIERALTADGVELLTGCKTLKVEMRGLERVLSLEIGGKKRELIVDAILISAGRAPNVEGIGLEASGVQFDPRKGVVVNDALQTSNPNIYAAGDCCFRYQFTHVADALARIVIQNALFPGFKKKASALTVPWCTYTEPEIAHVGLYEKDAKERGLPVRTFTQEFSDVDRAILDGEEEGFVKVHVEEGKDKIVGATIVASHAGEMISELTLAITAGVGLGRIAQVIHPYPTQAECIKKVGDAYNRTRLTPFVKRLLSRWLAWRRR